MKIKPLVPFCDSPDQQHRRFSMMHLQTAGRRPAFQLREVLWRARGERVLLAFCAIMVGREGECELSSCRQVFVNAFKSMFLRSKSKRARSK